MVVLSVANHVTQDNQLYNLGEFIISLPDGVGEMFRNVCTFISANNI